MFKICFSIIALCSIQVSSNEKFEDGFNLVEEESLEKGDLFYLCKQLYNNYVQNSVISDEYQIPKNIHFIWLGSPLPEKCALRIETWRLLHPDWNITIWTDGDVEGFNLVNKKAFLKATNYGQKSDIWRFEILYRYGGVYVDIDFDCLQSFDTLHKSCEFYAGISRCGTAVMNSLIGSKPHHPILKESISQLKAKPRQTDYVKIMEETGPYYFAKIIQKTAFLSPKGSVAIFPPIFFFPYPGIYRGKLDEEAISMFAKEESMAIHYWSTSWQKKLKLEKIDAT